MTVVRTWREISLVSLLEFSFLQGRERERDLSFSLFLKWVVSNSSCYKTHLKQEKKVTVFLYLCNVLISKKKKRLFWGVFICISLVLLSNFDGMVNGFWRTHHLERRVLKFWVVIGWFVVWCCRLKGFGNGREEYGRIECCKFLCWTGGWAIPIAWYGIHQNHFFFYAFASLLCLDFAKNWVKVRSTLGFSALNFPVNAIIFNSVYLQLAS